MMQPALTFKTSVGLAIAEDTTPDSIPHTTLISRVSSINKAQWLAFVRRVFPVNDSNIN